MSDSLFCFGMGFCANALGKVLVARGWRVSGTSRSGDGNTGVFETLSFDGAAPVEGIEDLLSTGPAVLVSVPPDEAGDPVLRFHEDMLVRHAREIPWVGYLSTTGVYGDRGGAWVDETDAPGPSGERGRRRVEAEEAWLRLHRDHGLPVHIFRLAGIYGPGRNQLQQVRDGKARRVAKKNQVFGRIHVEDVAQVLAASLAKPDPGAAYNVCDDVPAPPQDVVAYAAELLGVEPPPLVPFEKADLSAMARSFYDDNRRVRNDRIKEELGVELLYPDYRAGLRALYEAGEGR